MKTSSILLAIASSALVSCKCFGPECCPGDKIRVDLSVHDAAGRSLLDPDTPGYFHVDSIRLFSLIDGQLIPQNMQGQQEPVALDTVRIFGNVVTAIYPRYDAKDLPQTTTTVIKWSATQSDTIQFEVVVDCDWPLVKTVWLNGDITHSRPVKIVK